MMKSHSKRTIFIVLAVLIILIAAYFATISFAQNQFVKQLKRWQVLNEQQGWQIDLHYQQQFARTDGDVTVYRSSDHAKIAHFIFQARTNVLTTNIEGKLIDLVYIGSEGQLTQLIDAEKTNQAAPFVFDWKNLTNNWKGFIDWPNDPSPSIHMEDSRISLQGNASGVTDIKQYFKTLQIQSNGNRLNLAQLSLDFSLSDPHQSVFCARNDANYPVSKQFENVCWSNFNINAKLKSLDSLQDDTHFQLSNLVWQQNDKSNLLKMAQNDLAFEDFKSDGFNIHRVELTWQRQTKAEDLLVYELNAKIQQALLGDFPFDAQLKSIYQFNNNAGAQAFNELMHVIEKKLTSQNAETSINWPSQAEILPSFFKFSLYSHPLAQIENLTISSEKLKSPVLITAQAFPDPEITQGLIDKKLSFDEQIDYLPKLWQANITVKNLPSFIGLLLGRFNEQSDLYIQFRKGSLTFN